jgi:hypothetical protein
MLADGDSSGKVARNTGLPLRKVKALLKSTTKRNYRRRPVLGVLLPAARNIC